jgi:hypothetical protein
MIHVHAQRGGRVRGGCSFFLYAHGFPLKRSLNCPAASTRIILVLQVSFSLVFLVIACQTASENLFEGSRSCYMVHNIAIRGDMAVPAADGVSSTYMLYGA